MSEGLIDFIMEYAAGYPQRRIKTAQIQEALAAHDRDVRNAERERCAQIAEARTQYEAPNARLAVEFVAKQIRAAVPVEPQQKEGN